MSQQKASFRQIIICLVIFFGFHWFARNGYDTFAHTIAHLGFFFLALYLSWHLSKFISLTEVKTEPNDKAVLITGCDTGFGNIFAKQLSNLGYQVFAGVLFPDREAAQSLEKYGPNLHIIKMDVTNNNDIQAAKDFVINNLKPNRKLWAIVNNAGIGGFSAIEWGSDSLKENFHDLFDVNTFGVVRVTRSFLPLLRQTKNSRVVIVGSLAGQVTFPGLTPYSMSKHAVRAFGDGLRREISYYGINVSIIEPNMYATRITDNEFISNVSRDAWSKSPAHLRAELGEQEYQRFMHCQTYLNCLKRTNIQEVIDALLSSVTTENPRVYYKVGGYTDKVWLHLFSLLPIEIQDIYCDKVYLNSIIKLVQNQS
ncbi:17-beta-hydroxysteroid dehydrogenase type 6 [Tetranychus urticae]|uniref:Uncharacterized protein n=1 Tax=Tetranychus urticae TaxID=32264 RepID=T1JYG6_TETUR|nr:17-beta-hydroxysteroid dehydrogenase type 6 [Tetranychus urticae]